MRAFFQKLLGVNWRTTFAAIVAIIGLAINIQVAWKAKDIRAVANNAEMIMLNLGLIATALTGLNAKDANVTGAGTQAKTVDSTGAVTNVDGAALGNQPMIPPQPKTERAA